MCYMATSIYLQAASRFVNLIITYPAMCTWHVVQHTDMSALALQNELHLVPFASRLARVSISVAWVGIYNMLFSMSF